MDRTIAKLSLLNESEAQVRDQIKRLKEMMSRNLIMEAEAKKILAELETRLRGNPSPPVPPPLSAAPPSPLPSTPETPPE
jgi:hypothetical protein